MDTLKEHATTGQQDIVDTLFRIGMVWRICYGTLRFILGLLLLKVIGTPIADIFYSLMSHEIIEDSSDIFIQTIHPILQHHSFKVTYFLAAYLIFWGLIDVTLSYSLLKKHLWAFPISIYLIIIFACYEIYRFTHTHSLILAGVIVIDVILVFLIRSEYYKLKRTLLKVKA